MGICFVRVLLMGVIIGAAAGRLKAQPVPYTGIDQSWEPRISFERITTGVAELGWRVEVATQDAAGYIWFGSRNGLTRYDGHDFTHYYRNARDPDTPDTDWISFGILYKDDDRGGAKKRYKRVAMNTKLATSHDRLAVHNFRWYMSDSINA